MLSCVSLLCASVFRLSEMILDGKLPGILDQVRPLPHRMATLCGCERKCRPARLQNAGLTLLLFDFGCLCVCVQGTGDLILFSELQVDKSYANADGTVKELNLVVDRLYARAKHLTK